MTRLTHPDKPGHIITPSPEHADVYRSQGWADVPALPDEPTGAVELNEPDEGAEEEGL